MLIHHVNELLMNNEVGASEGIMHFGDIIEIKNVTKQFKEVIAVNNISLSITKGSFVAILGPNGAGKTTLVEMMEGLQSPTSGDVRVLGKTWEEDKQFLYHQVGISLQETRFIDKLTVRETLGLFASFYGINGQRVREVMDLVKINEKHKSYVVNLSGGQRQRLALAIALLNNPPLLMLDEPTTGLDPSSRHELWDILLDLKKQKGTTLILTTHYMEEASLLCDMIIIMDRGSILARGTLNELLAMENKGEVIDFETSSEIDLAKLKKIEGTRDVSREGKHVKMVVNGIVDELPRVLKFFDQENIRLDSLECRKYTLDDLFLTMTGRRLNE